MTKANCAAHTNLLILCLGAPTPSLGELKEEVEEEGYSPGKEKLCSGGEKRKESDSSTCTPRWSKLSFEPLLALVCHQLLEFRGFQSILESGPLERGFGRIGSLVLDCKHSGALYPQQGGKAR